MPEYILFVRENVCAVAEPTELVDCDCEETFASSLVSMREVPLCSPRSILSFLLCNSFDIDIFLLARDVTRRPKSKVNAVEVCETSRNPPIDARVQQAAHVTPSLHRYPLISVPHSFRPQLTSLRATNAFGSDTVLSVTVGSKFVDTASSEAEKSFDPSLTDWIPVPPGSAPCPQGDAHSPAFFRRISICRAIADLALSRPLESLSHSDAGRSSLEPPLYMGLPGRAPYPHLGTSRWYVGKVWGQFIDIIPDLVILEIADH